MCPCDYDDQAAQMAGFEGAVTCKKRKTKWSRVAKQVLRHAAITTSLIVLGIIVARVGNAFGKPLLTDVGGIITIFGLVYPIAPVFSKIVDFMYKAFMRPYRPAGREEKNGTAPSKAELKK